MKAFFDRTTPLFVTVEPTFDGTPIEIDPVVVKNLQDFATLMADMEVRIRDAASPERADEELAAYFEKQVRKLFRARKGVTTSGK